MSIDAGGVRISPPDEETCWADLGGPAGQALPCNQPAENGVGLCERHLESLRQVGR